MTVLPVLPVTAWLLVVRHETSVPELAPLIDLLAIMNVDGTANITAAVCGRYGWRAIRPTDQERQSHQRVTTCRGRSSVRSR